MNKKSFAKIYKTLGGENMTHKEALHNINEFLEILEKILVNDGQVKLVRKAVFEAIERQPRRISNPQTREIMEIYPKKTVRFRASKNISFN